MVNSIKSLLEIDENTARKFTVVHILENCVNNIKYSMLSTALTTKAVLLIIENVAIFDKLGNSGVHKFFKNPVINREQRIKKKNEKKKRKQKQNKTKQKHIVIIFSEFRELKLRENVVFIL